MDIFGNNTEGRIQTLLFKHREPVYGYMSRQFSGSRSFERRCACGEWFSGDPKAHVAEKFVEAGLAFSTETNKEES